MTWDADANTIEVGNHVGFRFCIKHNGIGYRCGYVLIPAGHDWHSQDYEKINVDVHGGLTFAANEGGEYWIGFDCAHSGDAMDPTLLTADKLRRIYVRDGYGAIRTTEYVRAECMKLCEQAATAAKTVAAGL